MVGRDAELRDLTRLFAEHRFITLVGPGGVGKTRLALEVGRAEAEGLSFGGCLVELAPVGDPAGVPAAIASALDLPDPNRLAEMIGDRELLIVLDNCEHVITAAAEVAEDLLRRCPGLRLLATSREGLRVGGETIWPVPPLAADDAVRLFVARAQAAGAALELSDDQHGVIADICTRLDGLPLAIELAAARTRAFPITQISARLNDRFRLLTGGSRTALPRQQTLRAVVDWSYELLFDDEQRVFERLSVFPGGCDLATAEAVCADDDDRGGRRRRSSPRPRRQVPGGRRSGGRRAAVHPAPDARPVRPGAAHRTWRRGAHPRRDGEALRASCARRAPPPSPVTSSERG